MKNHGPWKIKNTEKVYEDNFVLLQVDDVLKPNGEPGTYATFAIKEGIAVLPITDDGQVYLTRQFRYAAGKDSIEVISGGMDGQEPPLKTAKRETKEEAGLEADEWIELGYFDLETSIIKGPVHLYLARKLRFSENAPDDTEDIRRFKISFDEALKMVMENIITHGPSCVLILKAYQYLQKSA